MRLLLIAVSLLTATACNYSPAYLPDGGRVRQTCSNVLTSVPVTVFDSAGAPVQGATVTATNAQTGLTQSGATDARGVFEITEAIGAGAVQITAKKTDFTSQEQDATFICGECDCAVSPHAITLNLK